MSRTSMLQETFETRGEFWLPSKTDRVRGRLSYDAGRIELELFGSFGQPLTKDDLPETELILGYTEAGRCTLKDCIRINAKSKVLSGTDLAHSIWMATHLFLGAEFEQAEQIVFSSISFGFDALERWLVESPFDHSIETDPAGNSVTTAQHRFPESPTIPLPGQDASLEVTYAFRRSGDLFCSIVWEHEAGLKVVPAHAQHYDWFGERLSDLRSLLGLLVGEAVTPTRVSARLPDDERAEVGVYFPYVGELRERLLHPAQMLLACDKIGDRLPSIVERWFERREVLHTTVALLFGTLYTKDLPGEFRFLALTQALETFHRRVYGGLYVSREEYSPVKQTLLAAIPDETPDGLRQALSDRLRYGNELSQSQRLGALMNSLDEESRLIVSSDPDFVGRVVKQRNHLTHYPEGKAAPMDPQELFYASLRLRALVMFLLLKEIGIEGKEAAEGMRRTRWSRMLRH